MSSSAARPLMYRPRSTFLSFAPPFIDEEEINAVTEVLRSGWLSRGPRTAEFEAAFAAAVGAPSALGVNSCTAALHLALRVLDVGAGDEVIAPSMTFCASVNVVEHVGARPVLVDVEPDTLNLDPRAVEAAITPQTRAIIVVHYGGHPADLDALEAIADRHGIPIIEDAAHALPAFYRGRPVGSARNLAAYSFYATKNLTTGEGGMLTGPVELVQRARVLSLHGMSGDAWTRYSPKGSWHYEVVEPGYKYNMTDVQAALGLQQLAKLPAMQRRRREIVAEYAAAFGRGVALELPVERPDVESAWHLYPVRLRADSPIGRDDFIEQMKACNIGTSVHFIPVHLHPYYAERYGYRRGDLPVTEAAFERIVSLPLHPGLTAADLDDIIGAVRYLCGA